MHRLTVGPQVHEVSRLLRKGPLQDLKSWRDRVVEIPDSSKEFDPVVSLAIVAGEVGAPRRRAGGPAPRPGFACESAGGFAQGTEPGRNEKRPDSSQGGGRPHLERRSDSDRVGWESQAIPNVTD